jgi:arylsulfatase A-like enzyme
LIGEILNKKNQANIKKHNLIVIVVDALRAQNLSCYGYNQETTPFIDSLARSGLLFENFCAVTDQTDPAFTSMFSGRYPLTHGIIFHGNFITHQQKNDLKNTNTKFLAEFFKEKDQDMVTIGIDWLSRWHKRGFDIYGEEEVLTDPQKLLVKYKWINEKLKRFVNHFSLNWYYAFNDILSPFGFKYRNDAEGYFEYARLAINKYAANKNFYLLIHLWDVHSPWNLLPNAYVKKFDHGKREGSVEESLKKYDSKKFKDKVTDYHLRDLKYLSEVEIRYNAALNYVDTELAKFVDFLKDKKLWEDTYLMVTGDHGENLVVDDRFASHMGSSNRVMKVPFIMVGPGLPVKRIEEPVQHIDFLPTIFDLFNIKTDYKFNGSSLMPLINDEATDWRNEILFVGSAANKRYTLMNERFKFNYSPTEEDSDDKVGGLWYHKRIELFDLKADPDEKNDLTSEKPEVADLMEKRLTQILNDLSRTKERYILGSSLRKFKLPSDKI